jgi:hypothetical protein
MTVTTSFKLGAVEQRHAPDEALGLKTGQDAPGIINVRLAGDAWCWTDMRRE